MLSVVRSKNIEEPVVYVLTSVFKILHHNNVHGSAESSWVIKHYVLKAIVLSQDHAQAGRRLRLRLRLPRAKIRLATPPTAKIRLATPRAAMIGREEIAMDLYSPIPASCSVAGRVVVVAQTHAVNKFRDLVASLVVNARTVGFPVTQFFLGISPTATRQKEY